MAPTATAPLPTPTATLEPRVLALTVVASENIELASLWVQVDDTLPNLQVRVYGPFSIVEGTGAVTVSVHGDGAFAQFENRSVPVKSSLDDRSPPLYVALNPDPSNDRIPSGKIGKVSALVKTRQLGEGHRLECFRQRDPGDLRGVLYACN